MRLRTETLEKYITLAKDRLVKVAEKGETITYNELVAEIGGPGRGYIGQVLREVCLREHKQGRPLLGALVVHKNSQYPGKGFWKSPPVLESIGKCSMQQKIAFWENERQKVYEYWQKHKS